MPRRRRQNYPRSTHWREECRVASYRQLHVHWRGVVRLFQRPPEFAFGGGLAGAIHGRDIILRILGMESSCDTAHDLAFMCIGHADLMRKVSTTHLLVL